MNAPDPFVLQHEGLVKVHQAIVSVLGRVAFASDAALALDVLVPNALGGGRFLLGHHDAEGQVLFPGLRRLGRLKSADVAFLDARDREHHELHALCERLLGGAGAPHPDAGELVTVARAILEGATRVVIGQRLVKAADGAKVEAAFDVLPNAKARKS